MDKKRIEVGTLTLMMTLVWAVSWGVSWAVGWSMVRYVGLGYSFFIGGQIGGIVAGVIAGGCGGIGTAITLRLATPSLGLRLYHTILLAVGWAVIVFYDWSDGFVVAAPGGQPIEYGTGGPLSGVLGGIFTALILLWVNHRLTWKQLLLIIGGWTLGFSLAGFIAWIISFEVAVSYVYGPIHHRDPGFIGFLLITTISTICGALAGWLGGVMTIRQLLPKPRLVSELDEPISKLQAVIIGTLSSGVFGIMVSMMIWGMIFISSDSVTVYKKELEVALPSWLSYWFIVGTITGLIGVLLEGVDGKKSRIATAMRGILLTPVVGLGCFAVLAVFEFQLDVVYLGKFWLVVMLNLGLVALLFYARDKGKVPLAATMILLIVVLFLQAGFFFRSSWTSSCLPNCPNQNWLVTQEELNALSEDIGVVHWRLEEEIPGQFRVCRMFVTSMNVNSNETMNCVNYLNSGSTFEDIVDTLYDQQVLYPADIALKPSFNYNGRFALYAQGGEGPPFYDAFLVGEGTLFRATIGLEAPAGYTPEMLFEEQRDVIEPFLNNILLINLERSGQSAILGSANAYNNQGKAFFQIGDYEQASVSYTRALELNSEDADAYYNRARADHQLGEYEQAIGDYTKAIELNYDPLSWAYNDRGLIYRRLGDDNKALADFNTALQLDPDYVGAYFNRGRFYASQGDEEQAIADYSQAIALNPDLARAYISRGGAYGRLGNYEQAVADYTKAIELDPNDAAAYNDLAWTLAVELDTDYETALKHAQHAVELAPSSATHDTLAMVYFKLEQYDKALEQYDLALSLDDEQFYSHKGRGDVYLALGNEAAALADYEAYLVQAPAGPERDEVEEIVKSLQEL